MSRIVKYINPEKGRGVFATTDFLKDEIVEECQTLFTIDTLTVDVLTRLPFIQKVFFNLFEKPEKSVAIALGTGSLYNHSSTPNLEFYPHVDPDTKLVYIRFVATRQINSGEELTIDYTGGGKRKAPLDFEEEPQPKLAWHQISKPEEVVPKKFQDIDGWSERLREEGYFTKQDMADVINVLLQFGKHSFNQELVHAWKRKAKELSK